MHEKAGLTVKVKEGLDTLVAGCLVSLDERQTGEMFLRGVVVEGSHLALSLGYSVYLRADEIEDAPKIEVPSEETLREKARPHEPGVYTVKAGPYSGAVGLMVHRNKFRAILRLDNGEGLMIRNEWVERLEPAEVK